MQHVQEEGEEDTREEARKESQDLDRQLRKDAEVLRRSAASQTGAGIPPAAFGPPAMPSSAQGAQSSSGAAAQERWAG